MIEERMMTREHLSEAYKEKIRKELRKALTHFGEWDKKRMERTIESNVFNLWIDLAAIDGKTVDVGNGEVVKGYPMCVASKGEDFPDTIRNGEVYMHERMYVVNLMINKDGFQYVLHGFDCYDKHGSHFAETEFDNLTYKKVKLEDLDKNEYSFSIKM